MQNRAIIPILKRSFHFIFYNNLYPREIINQLSVDVYLNEKINDLIFDMKINNCIEKPPKNDENFDLKYTKIIGCFKSRLCGIIVKSNKMKNLLNLYFYQLDNNISMLHFYYDDY